MWGFSAEELSARFSRADYAVLQEIDFSRADISQALSLGPGAPYYLSFILDALKKPEPAELMLELAWNRSPSPWKEEAGILLAERFLAEKDYARAEGTARVLLSRGAGAADRARRVLASSLYWSREDEKALAELDRITVPDPELALFRAVSTLRLKRDAARGLFVDLFLRQKVSPLHARAFLFLGAEEDGLAVFSEQERDLLAAKFALQQGDWARGIPLMEKVITAFGASLPAGATLVAELGTAYLSAGLAARGVDFMDGLARTVQGGARLDALEAGGKCARRVAAYGRALESLRTLAAEAGDDERADRARWLVLDVLLKSGPADLFEQIGRESAGWHDPAFFTDLLEVEVSSLVADRRWKDIYRLSLALEGNGPGPVRAQLFYILARALQERLIPRVPGTGQDRSADDLLRAALQASPNRYYGVLAACLLGEVPPPVESAAGIRLDAPAVPAAEDKAGPHPVRDPLTRGFIAFGLTSQAFDRLWAARDSLEDAEVAAAARSLSAAGDHRHALNLMGFLSRRRPLTGQDLALFYPRAYRPLIDVLAAKTRFPDFLLYGLVREESYFDEKIVSSAGAVGLAQLMPETAADAARILRISAPDLTDPETNLSLGVEHLRGLYVRVGSVPMALLAYNAGLRRSKRWDRVNGWLSTDLFVEAVPYGESREYVRKILVSAIMYAYLYAGQEARETVRLFYPDALTSGRQPAGPLKQY